MEILIAAVSPLVVIDNVVHNTTNVGAFFASAVITIWLPSFNHVKVMNHSCIVSNLVSYSLQKTKELLKLLKLLTDWAVSPNEHFVGAMRKLLNLNIIRLTVILTASQRYWA